MFRRDALAEHLQRSRDALAERREKNKNFTTEDTENTEEEKKELKQKPMICSYLCICLSLCTLCSLW